MKAAAAVILMLVGLLAAVSLAVTTIEGQHTTALWVRNGIFLVAGVLGVMLLVKAREGDNASASGVVWFGVGVVSAIVVTVAVLWLAVLVAFSVGLIGP